MKPKPGHKVCSMCGQELPLDMFPTNRGMADGHLGKCFACWDAFTSDRLRVQCLRERKEMEPATNETGVEVKPPPPEPKPEPQQEDIPPTASAEEAKRMAKRMYARAYYRANRETVRDYQRRYFATEKGRAAEQRARRKRNEWKQTDPERWEELLAKQRAYLTGLSAERRAERNAKLRAYYRANKERWQTYREKNRQKSLQETK